MKCGTIGMSVSFNLIQSKIPSMGQQWTGHLWFDLTRIVAFFDLSGLPGLKIYNPAGLFA